MSNLNQVNPITSSYYIVTCKYQSVDLQFRQRQRIPVFYHGYTEYRVYKYISVEYSVLPTVFVIFIVYLKLC